MARPAKYGKIGTTLVYWDEMMQAQGCAETDWEELARYQSDTYPSQHSIAFANYLQAQANLPAERATLITWVAQGRMSIHDALDFYADVRKHRRTVNGTAGRSNRVAGVFGYSDIDAACVFYDVLRDSTDDVSGRPRNTILAVDQKGILFDRAVMGHMQKPGGVLFEDTFTAKVKRGIEALVEHSFYDATGALILSTWDESEDFMNAIRDLPHQGIHVVAKITSQDFFSVFDVGQSDLQVRWLRPEIDGKLAYSVAKLSEIKEYARG